MKARGSRWQVISSQPNFILKIPCSTAVEVTLLTCHNCLAKHEQWRIL